MTNPSSSQRICSNGMIPVFILLTSFLDQVFISINIKTEPPLNINTSTNQHFNSHAVVLPTAQASEAND